MKHKGNIMKHSKSLSRYLLALPLTLSYLSAFAHTEIESQAIEGQLSRNAVTMGHGCESSTGGPSLPIIAQSVLIPTVNPIITRSDGKATTLSAEITASTLESLIEVPQSRDIFNRQSLKTNPLGNAIGLLGTQGRLQTELKGRVPVNFVPVSFQKNACAKSLKVEIAIADVCQKTFPPHGQSANTWIPRLTKTFTDANNDGIGNPAVLEIRRDLASNPLPPSCGQGYDVTVSPSNEDIDAGLVFGGRGK